MRREGPRHGTVAGGYTGGGGRGALGPARGLECTLPGVVSGWEERSEWQGLEEVDVGERCEASKGGREYV